MGEVAHPGPYRRLRRQADALMPSCGLSTQATVVDRSESDNEMPLVRGVSGEECLPQRSSKVRNGPANRNFR